MSETSRSEVVRAIAEGLIPCSSLKHGRGECRSCERARILAEEVRRLQTVLPKTRGETGFTQVEAEFWSRAAQETQAKQENCFRAGWEAAVRLGCRMFTETTEQAMIEAWVEHNWPENDKRPIGPSP